MNDQATPPEIEQPPAPATPPRKTALADLFARMNLTQLTLAVLTVIFLWQWLDGQQEIGAMRKQLAEKSAEMNGDSKANQMLLAQSQEQIRDLSVKVAMLDTRYAEAQNQRVALEALYNDLSASRDETSLAEVEQLLLIAEQQLQLSGNVKAALIAMENADARLQRMDRAAFNGLRKAIGLDVGKLRALPSTDVTGINLQLNDMIYAADGLPLLYQQRVPGEAGEQQAAPEGGTFWQRLGSEVWQEVKQLVRIENTERAEIPLLPPSQEFFLRENLKLRLLSARLALLSHDEDSFKLDLNTAQRWTSRYFDSKSKESARMQVGLKNLAAIDIAIEMPDISASLQAVRNYRLTHENTPGRNLANKAAR